MQRTVMSGTEACQKAMWAIWYDLDTCCNETSQAVEEGAGQHNLHGMLEDVFRQWRQHDAKTLSLILRFLVALRVRLAVGLTFARVLRFDLGRNTTSKPAVLR
jgi:hypothetical protein